MLSKTSPPAALDQARILVDLSDETVRVVGAVAPTGIQRMFEEEEAYFSTLTGPPDPARIA